MAVAIYTDGVTSASCEHFLGKPGEGAWTQGGISGPEPVTRRGSGHPVAIEGSLSGGIAAGDVATAVYGWVTPAVARVQVVSADGYVTTAAISGDLFTAWWPSYDELDPLGHPAVATAYDATGRVLGTDALHR